MKSEIMLQLSSLEEISEDNLTVLRRK